MVRHEDDAEGKRVLRDGEKMVVNMMLMDETSRAVFQGMARVIAGDGSDELALHRPGPRRLADQAADDQRAHRAVANGATRTNGLSSA